MTRREKKKEKQREGSRGGKENDEIWLNQLTVSV